MTESNILRNMMAIAICLAATTIGANAQIGNAIRNAANAAKNATTQAAGNATDGNSAAGNIISNSVATATLTAYGIGTDIVTVDYKP